jgi:hypothetical protein
MQLGFLCRVLRLPVTANVVPSSPIRVTLMMETIRAPKCKFLPPSETSQNTAFFIVTAVNMSNIAWNDLNCLSIADCSRVLRNQRV